MQNTVLPFIFCLFVPSALVAKEKIEVGSAAPSVVAQNHRGESVKLNSFFESGKTVIFFFPKAFTPGCTKQACSLRDNFKALKDLGVRVFGVSSDTTETLAKFNKEHKLPYDLIADPEKRVAEAFGVPTTMGYMDRQAFLISDGKVVWIDRDASTAEQAADVLRALDQLPK